MREIKFRVRDKSTKELLGYEHFNTSLNAGYYYIDLREPVDDGEGGVTHVCKTECSERAMLKPSHPLSGLLREQCTGLKDRNGVEIYEGDILNEPTSPVGGKDGGYKYTAREIKWQGAGRGYNLFAPHAASEVIGNIYENPELLESNND